jgi:hypothetical protein
MHEAYFNSLTGVNQTIMTNSQWTYFSKYMDVQLAA